MLSGKGKIAGVMGWPIDHSLSPRLHNFWLERYGIDGSYIPLSVRPEHLPQALRALPALGMKGCNITLPHKEPAQKSMDHLTDRARRAGAVNTVIVGEDGRLLGDNSDGLGFLAHLRQSVPNWQAGPTLLMGAGGAARALAASLLDEAKVPELRIVNRTDWRAQQMAADLGGPIKTLSWEKRHDALADLSLLINATYLGQAGQPPLHLDLQRLPDSAVLFDIVYVPLETPLLRAGKERGNRVVDGLGMLLHQAKLGFAAWFGKEPEIEATLRAHVLAGLPKGG